MTDYDNNGMCDHDGCIFPPFDNHKWGKIRASFIGWYFGKDGTQLCPLHSPKWLQDWRRKNAKNTKSTSLCGLSDRLSPLD